MSTSVVTVALFLAGQPVVLGELPRAQVPDQAVPPADRASRLPPEPKSEAKAASTSVSAASPAPASAQNISPVHSGLGQTTRQDDAALFLPGLSSTPPEFPLSQGSTGAAPPANPTSQLPSDASPQTDAAVVGTLTASPGSAPAEKVPPVDPDAAPTPDQDDILVTARPRHAPGDPLQAINAQSFAVTQAVDKAVVAPVAMTYERALPAPVRGAIRHFFNNLAEPVAFLNFMLQLKPGKAAETAGRFAINTTIGVAGIIDIAKKKPFRLPRKPNGFANTLGYYGVKPGPFLFLPLIGPTTVRDLIGLGIDRMFLPSAFGQPFNQPTYTVPASIVGSLDYRVEFDAQLRKLKDTPDPYAASRTNYLESRQAEIDALHGRRPEQPVLRRTLPVFP